MTAIHAKGSHRSRTSQLQSLDRREVLWLQHCTYLIYVEAEFQFLEHILTLRNLCLLKR